jgi:hypothetical protein
MPLEVTTNRFSDELYPMKVSELISDEISKMDFSRIFLMLFSINVIFL